MKNFLLPNRHSVFVFFWFFKSWKEATDLCAHCLCIKGLYHNEVSMITIYKKRLLNEKKLFIVVK